MVGKLVPVIGALMLALPSAVQAATFCVGTGPGCRATLQEALTDADADTTALTDLIELAPDDYVGPFIADEDNSVEIVGAGNDETVLTPGDGNTVISLAAPASSLRGVTVRPGAAGVGVRLTGGATLEQMTVEPAGDAATGVQVGAEPMQPASASLRHVTLAGDGTGTGLDVTASASSASSVLLSSSVITRFEVAIKATDAACPGTPCTPGLATVTADHSAYGPVTSTRPEGVTVATGSLEPVRDDPKLGDDLRPRFDSPLIDVAKLLADGETDASGALRVVDGDGDGDARGDIGALEYQRRAPVIGTATASPGQALVGAPITFSAAATDPDGEEFSAVWTFSDGATAPGLNVTHAFAAPGSATAELRVTDDAGVVTTKTVLVTIDLAPAPAGADPPATVTRRTVIARVLPAAVRLGAVARRDRRPPYRFRLRGRVVLPEGISTAGCRDGLMRLAIRAGKRRTTRTARLAPDCRFRLTLKLRGKRARRIVVRPRFDGTASLAPRDGAALRLRAG